MRAKFRLAFYRFRVGIIKFEFIVFLQFGFKFSVFEDQISVVNSLELLNKPFSIFSTKERIHLGEKGIRIEKMTMKQSIIIASALLLVVFVEQGERENKERFRWHNSIWIDALHIEYHIPNCSIFLSSIFAYEAFSYNTRF